MTLSNLSEAETEIVFQCLRCVGSGEVILNDWEFQTLFGISFQEFQGVVNALPAIDESNEIVHLAINNSLNNLLGYSHGRSSKWSTYISVPPAEVARVFSKWRGEPIPSYFEGIR